MALADKNILITPNIGSAVADPKIEFTGADAGSNVTITATMYADGTLSFDSALGQLFSIASVASGTIFSVADISGMPIIEADSDGSIRMAEFFGDVSIGTGTSVEKLTVAGNVQAVRFVSTQSTGTAPFTVSSTTLVTNLNADLLDGQSGAYYLDWANITSKPDPTIAVTLTGDVTGTGSVVVTDLATATYTVTFATTIASNSVALGTDTTGNYIATIAGTANQITVSGSGSETAAVTLSTPQDIHTAATPTFSRLTLSQTTGTAPMTVSSTTLVTNLNADLLDGQQGSYYLDWTNITNKPDPQITVTLTGDVTGTQTSTFTDLANGTISVATTIAANSIVLGTDTTGNYVATIAGTTNQISVSGSGSETAAVTLSTPQDIHTAATPTFSRLTLSQTTGTAPMTVSSTTVVTNLNADLLDGQQGSYYQDWMNVTNKPDPTIAVTLTGDVTGTGSVTVTDLDTSTHTITFATTIAANSVALGTDTTGSYIATIAGTTNQVNVSGSGSETAAVTLSLPQDVHSAATPTFSRLTLSQTTGTAPLTVSSTTVVTNLNADLLDGQQGSYYLDWANITSKPDPQITVTLTGDVTGTQTTTFTDLANGTISVATTIAANSIALGTDTTGNYVATIAGTTNQITVSGSGSETAAVTLSTPQDIHTAATPTFSRLTLSQTTGTAPLTISSTTAVTNLNADLLDGQHGPFWPVNGGAPVDLNTAGQGLWRINTGHTNQPAGTNHGTLLSFDTSSDTGFQLATDYASTHLWYRSGNATVFGGPGTFGAWRKLWHDGNHGAASGLDADLLDGQQGSYYLDWANITSKPDPQIGVTLAGDVSGTGSVTVTDLGTGPWTITIASSAIGTGTVTNAKLADMAQNTVKGRISSGTGDPEDLTAAQVIDIIETADGAGSGLDADLLDAQQGSYYLAFANFTGTVSTAQIANNAVDNTKIRDSAALSVIGNATNASADPADITAGTDGFVLRRAGTTLGFGTLGSSSIAAAAINGTHIDDEAIQSQHFEPDAVGTVAIADNAVTGAKLADYSITGSKISDGTVNSDKIDTSDTYNWFGPHSFKSDLNVDGVLYWNNTSAKLTQAVTVTTDNGSSWWFNLVNSGKTAGLLLYPLVPSVTITANDGAGNYSTIGMSSGGMNFQFAGTADLAVNGTVAALNEVIVGQGNDTPPKLVHLCPPIRYRWTDFESASVQMTSPYIGGAISSGDNTTTPPTAFFVDGTQGLLMARSSATTNSGYRWITEYSDRILGQADLYFRAVIAIADDMASKTVRFGFHDTTSVTDVVDGTYFELAPGSMVCSARSANNSARSSHGTTFTLTANTFYIFEIYWTSTSSINYKIKSLDEATTHLNVNKTTDIPTGTSRLFGAGLVATSTILAIDNLLVVDYMGHGFKNRR